MDTATPLTLEALAAAVVFAAIFLFGGRLHRPGKVSQRGLTSFAAGIAVAYVFVDVLPLLGRGQEIQVQAAGTFPLLFPEYSVYLWVMVGFLVFYGLERLAAGARGTAVGESVGREEPPGWEFWLHVGGFGAYAWFLTFFVASGLVRGWLGVTVYAVAMALHLLPVTHSLVHEYGRQYERVGSWLLATCALAGGVCGLLLDLPKPLVVILVALVMGGVIINSMIAELPTEKQGRMLPFFGGAAFYTALLLCLSHFEAGG